MSRFIRRRPARSGLPAARACMLAAVLAGAVMGAASTQAADILYTPVNPSFGGNPLNSSHLFSAANAQRTATASDANRGTGTTTGIGGTTQDRNAELFIRQLESRLISGLSSQVAEAIFGENPQDAGTVTFGDTQVAFERTLDSIRLTIDDFGAGTTTVIEVPQLVTNLN